MDQTHFNFNKSNFAVAEDGFLNTILLKLYNPQKIPWASDLNKDGAQIKTKIEKVEREIERLLTWIDFRNVGRGYDQLKFQIESYQKKAIPVLRSIAERLTSFDDSEAIKALYYEFKKDFQPLVARRKEIGLEIASIPPVKKPQFKSSKSQDSKNQNQNQNKKNWNKNEQERYNKQKQQCYTYRNKRIEELKQLNNRARALQRKYIYADIDEFITECDKIIDKYQKVNCNG